MTVPTSARATASGTYVGTLIAPAQCRMRAIDADGHIVPVLVLQLELDTLLRTRMRAEQPFAATAHQACEAAARRLRVGTVVEVEAPLTSVHLVATHTQHVHVLHHPEKEAQPS